MTKRWPFLSVLYTLVFYTPKARAVVESLGVSNYQYFFFFFSGNLGQTLEQNLLEAQPSNLLHSLKRSLQDQHFGNLWLWIRQDFVKIVKFSSFLPIDTSCEERMRPQYWKVLWKCLEHITEQLQRETNSIYILKAETCLTVNSMDAEKCCPLPFSKTGNIHVFNANLFSHNNQDFAITYKPHLYPHNLFHFFPWVFCLFLLFCFILRIIIISTFIIIKQLRRLKSYHPPQYLTW